jgi:SAM-dependent methyltransferase
VRTVLIAGSGPEEGPQWAQQGWSVVRLDIEPRTHPDLIGSMTKIPAPDASYEAVWCNNALEHLYPHEVNRALAEFYRVLKPGGYALVMVPNLENAKPTEDVIPEIGMSGLHLFYGDPALIEEFPYMAHHSGFVSASLQRVMESGASGHNRLHGLLPAHGHWSERLIAAEWFDAIDKNKPKKVVFCVPILNKPYPQFVDRSRRRSR